MELVTKRKRDLPLCKLLGVKQPIIQAPMAGGIVSAEFAATVSNAGLLGSLASGYLSLPEIQSLIHETQKSTHKPFQLNLFANEIDSPTDSLFITKPNEVIKLEKQLGIESSSHALIVEKVLVNDLVTLATENHIPIISTTFGVLDKEQAARVKSAGIKLMTTINSLADAHSAMVLNQPEVLIFQNKLAGGHQGGFNPEMEDDCDISDREVLLLKKTYPDLLIVKAGAIVTRDDITQALRQGFDGVQIGTAFLATKESSASEAHKQSILKATRVCDTCFNQSITGKRSRGGEKYVATIEIRGNLPLP